MLHYIRPGPPLREKLGSPDIQPPDFGQVPSKFLGSPIVCALLIKVQAPILNHITKCKWMCEILFQLWFVDTTKP